MAASLYIGLVHYPVLNKHGELVTTSVTNFDLHDISRTATTYGIEKYFVITPSDPQTDMVDYIKGYWKQGFGASYNPDRSEAFTLMEASSSIEETCLTIQNKHDISPRLVVTTARESEKSIDFNSLKVELEEEERPYLLLFGTGWGLAPQVFEKADHVLEPVRGSGPYNHLSVRAAVAVILDRLLGR